MSNRTDVTFESHGINCAAWLYRPDSGSEPHPVIVLGHGLGAVKEMGLDAYAERFTAAGFICLVFDYRHFGGSGGEPRQLLDIDRQLEDWSAAIAYAKTIEGADPGRIGLFGTSFGGGHVIITAANHPEVAAVVSQCPFTSGRASAPTLGIRGLAKVTALATRDLAAAAAGQPPVLVPLAGKPGSGALMNAADVIPGYLGLVPEGLGFINGVAARVGAKIPLHVPGTRVKDVQCPIMFSICDNDSVAPAGPTAKYAAQAPKGEIVHYPFGHFEIYTGAAFERAIVDQTDFFVRHLKP